MEFSGYHWTEALTFDDVLLVPQYSEVIPKEAELSTQVTRNHSLNIPVLSAAMDTVTGWEMAVALGKLGGLGVLHRNMDPVKQADAVARVKREGLLAAAAVGTGETHAKRADILVEAGVDILVVDTAHGHSKRVLETVSSLKRRHPHTDVLAGNIATEEGARALTEAGADGIKVGIGPGSICTTRIVAGVGIPQLSAILWSSRFAHTAGIPLIADGGMRHSGDAVKALAAGASALMFGSLFAGTDEAPGHLVTVGGRKMKAYRGMGSAGAMAEGSSDRYFQEGAGKFVPEGVEGYVPYKGPLADVVFELIGGIRSGMGYLGARNIPALWEQRQFVRITGNGLRESHPHDISLRTEPS